MRRAATTAAWLALAASAALLAPHSLSCQTTAQLGAWYGLMLSPVGALPPLAHDAADGDPRPNALSLRFGFWKYDINDVAHDNVGLTVSHRVAFARSVVSFSGAYLSSQCVHCAAWFMGGLDIRSTLWNRVLAGSGNHALTAGLGVAASLGAARNQGQEHSTAGSGAAALAFDVGAPFIAGSRVALSLTPGGGLGRIASPDLTSGSALPMRGAALAWNFPSGLGVDVGMQNVVIAGGASQIGAGLSWRLR